MHTPAPLQPGGRGARLPGMASTRFGGAALNARTAIAVSRATWRLRRGRLPWHKRVVARHKRRSPRRFIRIG